MPEMNGWEVCKNIKSDSVLNTIKVIMMSAHATTNEDYIAGMESGADAYIMKPDISRDIVKIVDKYLK